MRVKGFVFTVDALASIILVTVAAAAIIVFDQSGSVQPHAFESLGRDYLEQNFVGGNTINSTLFTQLTGFNVSNTTPTGTLVARSSLVVYPRALAGCNCTAASCGLAVGVNDSCFSSQENLNDSLKQVWVTA